MKFVAKIDQGADWAILSQASLFVKFPHKVHKPSRDIYLILQHTGSFLLPLFFDSCRIKKFYFFGDCALLVILALGVVENEVLFLLPIEGLLVVAVCLQPYSDKEGVSSLLFVMIFAGYNLNGCIGDSINQPVLIVDSSRPVIFELMFQ